MIIINKYHETVDGCVANSVSAKTEEDALKIYHQLAANYMADKSVLCWGLSIIEISNGQMVMTKRDSYVRPVMPKPETAEEAG